MLVVHNGLLYKQKRDANDVFYVSFHINHKTHILSLNSYVGERISLKTLTEIFEQQAKRARSEMKRFYFRDENFIKQVYENLEKSFNYMGITVESEGL